MGVYDCLLKSSPRKVWKAPYTHTLFVIANINNIFLKSTEERVQQDLFQRGEAWLRRADFWVQAYLSLLGFSSIQMS